MTILTSVPSLRYSVSPVREPRTRNYPRIFFFVSCRGGGPGENPDSKPKSEVKQEKKLLLHRQILGSVEKVGKEMKDALSPKRKGDWKDVALMSLSFAVYVYISQQIVCAYCAWMSMPNQSW